MEKGVASAIWWIRPTMLQVRVNLSPFALNFIYSLVLGGLDDARVVLGIKILGHVHIDSVLKSEMFLGFDFDVINLVGFPSVFLRFDLIFIFPSRDFLVLSVCV